MTGLGDYYVPLAQETEPVVAMVLDPTYADRLSTVTATAVYSAPATTDVAYRLDRSTDGGSTYEWVQDWTAGDLSEALDTDALPAGDVILRVQARHAAEPLDVSGYDTVTVTTAPVEYEADYRIDGGAWTPLQAWAGDRSEALDTTALGAWSTLDVRVRARDAANPADVSAYDTVSYTATAATGETVAPSFIASTSQVFAPTVEPGAVQVVPAFIASTAEVFTPAVVEADAPIAVEPAFIGSGATVYAPTITEGDQPVTVAPAFIASTAAVYAPTITAGTAGDTVAPAFIGSSAVVFAPSVVGGAATVLPAFIVSTATVYAPTVGAAASRITGPLTATLTDSRRTITLADSRLTITLG